ncbi:hypothetical protein V3W46_00280 [Subtercola sp. YIM 133946]
MPLYFRYTHSSLPAINRDWIAVMTASANSGAGLTFIEEPGERTTPLPKPSA